MGDPRAADAFEKILAEESPDLVHQHALTPACSVEMAERVKASGRPLVFTYHTPTVSCVRGTCCDGAVRSVTAVSTRERAAPVCSMPTASLPGWAAWYRLSGRSWAAASRLSAPRAACSRPYGCRGSSAVSMRALRRLFEIADAIVAPAPWVRDLLLANGVARERIVLSRHGVTPAAFATRRRDAPTARGSDSRTWAAWTRRRARGFCSTRWGSARKRRIELDIYGVSQGDGSRSLPGTARGAGRQRCPRPVPFARAARPRGRDARRLRRRCGPLAGTRTGPLVVLEAFAAGVPVIGSDLGGIAEKVRHGVDGLLVRPFDSPARWAEMLSRAAADLPALRALGPNVRQPRSTEAVADEMLTVYERVTHGQMFIAPDMTMGSAVGRKVRVLYVQCTNPAVYPPLLHSIGLLRTPAVT